MQLNLLPLAQATLRLRYYCPISAPPPPPLPWPSANQIFQLCPFQSLDFIQIDNMALWYLHFNEILSWLPASKYDLQIKRMAWGWVQCEPPSQAYNISLWSFLLRSSTFQFDQPACRAPLPGKEITNGHEKVKKFRLDFPKGFNFTEWLVRLHSLCCCQSVVLSVGTRTLVSQRVGVTKGTPEVPNFTPTEDRL